MIIKTIQTYIIEYEVPSEEETRFHDMLFNEEDTSEYEIDQEFIGEHIIVRTDS
jgi:hypothetical protein